MYSSAQTQRLYVTQILIYWGPLKSILATEAAGIPLSGWIVIWESKLHHVV